MLGLGRSLSYFGNKTRICTTDFFTKLKFILTSAQKRGLQIDLTFQFPSLPVLSRSGDDLQKSNSIKFQRLLASEFHYLAKEMTTLIFSRLNISQTSFHKSNYHYSKPKPKPKPINLPQFLNQNPLFPKIRMNNPSLCTKNNNNISWQESQEPNTSIFSQSNPIDSIDSIDPPQIPFLQSESDQNIIDLKKSFQNQVSNLKSLPMWILGPLVLLITGIAPTLYLPLSSVFVGPTIAGLFSLIGLDCIFNMGAMIFLLTADSLAPKSQPSFDRIAEQIVPNYRAWNFGASLLAFLTPFILLFISNKGSLLQPQLDSISFLVLMGPYLLLLSIQMVTEMLTWHWRSPVWLITPVVYEGYRVLQLMRGISLANEMATPVWVVQALRGLVSWWVLVLGIQLMRVSWFVGSARQSNKSEFE
ncbi:hypothetical protein LUZ60_016644 [Juncus effusus]|nr:hypothetical protein LUZ60_016644 [Juncus effusus]